MYYLQVWRLVFGVATKNNGKVSWLPLFEFSKSICGCYILSVSLFFVTFMGNECYYHCEDLDYEDSDPDDAA